jgi:hyaluronoglucosaminidase
MFVASAAVGLDGAASNSLYYVGPSRFVGDCDKAGKAIRVGSGPDWIAITPNSRTVYVYNDHYGTVTPIRTATNTAAKAIRVGGPIKEDTPPPYIAITPNGKTVYVSNAYLGVVPIRTATDKVGRTMLMEGGAIAITP